MDKKKKKKKMKNKIKMENRNVIYSCNDLLGTV